MSINEQPTRPKGDDIRTSKYLSYILRHGAAERGLQMRPDGFVRVSDLLQLPESRSRSLTLPILQVFNDIYFDFERFK
jgi:RNA:NAD 2'-phosphotransferase (TPT1/KptA family)